MKKPSKSLPSRPNLEYLRSEAKTLLADLRAGQADAVKTFIAYLPTAKSLKPSAVRAAGFRLADAQSVIARKSGFANWPGLAVRHLMTAPPITVTRSTPLSAAAARMERNHIHRLVVVADDDETIPIGILSTTDLVHDMARLARDARQGDDHVR